MNPMKINKNIIHYILYIICRFNNVKFDKDKIPVIFRKYYLLSHRIINDY